MATNAASTVVFETFELLEHILLHLSCEDLTRVQRVHRTWRETTLESKVLHNTLLFLPRNGCHTSFSQHIGGFALNGICPKEPGQSYTIIDLNPALQLQYNGSECNGASLYIEPDQAIICREKDGYSISITKPPVYFAVLELYPERQRPGRTMKVENNCGIRVGDVTRLLREAVSEHEERTGSDGWKVWLGAYWPKLALHTGFSDGSRESLKMSRYEKDRAPPVMGRRGPNSFSVTYLRALPPAVPRTVEVISDSEDEDGS